MRICYKVILHRKRGSNPLIFLKPRETIEMRYIFNTTIIPTTHSDTLIRMQKIPLEMAQSITEMNDFISAIGHDATAIIISRLLKQEIKPNRLNTDLQPGDEVIAFKLKERLPEGKILSEQELENLPYDFYWVNLFSTQNTIEYVKNRVMQGDEFGWNLDFDFTNQFLKTK